MGAAIVGIYRQDVYEIPTDAIRELIINAMVHRSYLDHGTIQVAVYDNRLEITSPGKLPDCRSRSLLVAKRIANAHCYDVYKCKWISDSESHL